MLAAGSANAAISTTTSGNGELFLVINDTTAGYSFVGDLGIAMDSFNASLGQSFDLSSYSQWSAFNTAIGGTLNNATFAVLAVDSTGTGIGGDRMWVTSSTAISEADVAATQNKQLGAAAIVLDGTATVTVLNQLNANLGVVAGDMDSVANGSAYSADGSLTYWEGNVGDSMKTKLPFSVMVDANEAANFGFMVTTGTQVSLTAVNYAQAPGQWTVGANTLDYTVASVPEAETYAMMLAGLGLVGFMIRRRSNAA
jgi:hypothetical protein